MKKYSWGQSMTLLLFLLLGTIGILIAAVVAGFHAATIAILAASAGGQGAIVYIVWGLRGGGDEE